MAKITVRESAESKRKVNDHLKNADRFLKGGSLDLALSETEQALTLEPGNIYAQAFRKKILEMRGSVALAASSIPSVEAPVVAAPTIQPVSAPELAKPSRRRESQRKLAAIMFTDMVSYSSMTQMNELLAVQLLEEHRKILRPLFVQFEGDEIKTIGDAFLVEFVSVLQAVRCAIAIQNTVVERNKTAPGDHQLALRIGIHLGDVIYQEEDIIGDGVNIASRIHSSAEAGGICISQDVYNQIRMRQDIHTEEIGEVALKGIIAPVRLYKVFTSDEAYRRIEELAIAAATEEGKQQAFREVVSRCLNAASVAAQNGNHEEALSQVFGIYAFDPSNSEAKAIESRIVRDREVAFQAELEQARQVPREQFMELYARLLKRAWTDGALSTVEMSLLDNVRGSFRITNQEHQQLEKKIQREIYAEWMIRHREHADPDVEQTLQRLRRDFNIGDDEHAAFSEEGPGDLNTF